MINYGGLVDIDRFCNETGQITAQSAMPWRRGLSCVWTHWEIRSQSYCLCLMRRRTSYLSAVKEWLFLHRLGLYSIQWWTGKSIYLWRQPSPNKTVMSLIILHLQWAYFHQLSGLSRLNIIRRYNVTYALSGPRSARQKPARKCEILLSMKIRQW